MDATVTTNVRFVVRSDITTGSKFLSLYHAAHQIPQCHHTNLFPAPLILILQTCNL